MKKYHILIGNCDEPLSDYIEALFREACRGRASFHCTRAARLAEFVALGCESRFDLIVHIPHNLSTDLRAPTPLGLVGESIRALQTIRSTSPTPLIAIVAAEKRARYEPLLLEAGADCVLELPFDGEELTEAVGQLLKLPARLAYSRSRRWFFAGVLMRGLRRLSQA